MRIRPDVAAEFAARRHAELRGSAAAVLAGLDDEERQSFRALLQRLAVHAATTLDSAGPQPCTEPAPGNC